MVLDVMIVIIVIHVITVILTGKMKNFIHWIVIFICGILIILCCVFLVVINDYEHIWRLVLPMATLVVTCISLLFQQHGLIKQIRLSVFSDSMHLLMADDKFSKCQDYIFSKAYDDDIIIVQQVLKKNNQDDVDLDDFRRVLHQNRIDGEIINVDADKRERLRVSYNKIRYFLSRMEYLGVLSEERGVETLIIEYYGYTIISTFDRLRSIIEKTQSNPTSNVLYSHYVNLYTITKQKKSRSCHQK